MDAAEPTLTDATDHTSLTRVELGALRLTPERTIRAANAGFESVSGLRAASVARHDVLAIVAPADAAGLARAFSDAEELARTRRWPGELPRARARTAGGRPLMWTVAPELDGSGHFVGFSAVVEDVTAVEHAIELAERARPLLEHVPDLVGVADDRGNVVYLNAAARVAFGAADGETVSIERVFSPTAFDLYYREIRPALLRDASWQGVVPMRRADGSVFDAWQSVSAGIGADGATVEWLLAIGRDLALLGGTMLSPGSL